MPTKTNTRAHYEGEVLLLCAERGWNFEFARSTGGHVARVMIHGGQVEAWGKTQDEAIEWLVDTLQRAGVMPKDS